jgi:hypothetical protein
MSSSGAGGAARRIAALVIDFSVRTWSAIRMRRVCDANNVKPLLPRCRLSSYRQETYAGTINASLAKLGELLSEPAAIRELLLGG